MLTNPKSLMFLTTLTMGSLISMSATSWYGAWMGLEINLLSFIPLISSTKNQQMTESALKYFLIQAIASMLLLLSVIMSSHSPSVLEKLAGPTMLFSLTLKLGAAPLHFWMPEVMEGLSWNNCLLLMTWQKIAPLTLMSYSPHSSLLTFIVITSVILGATGGLNQTSLRKIMAFSSINHAGWLVSTMLWDNLSWFMYFILYTVMTLMSTTLFQVTKTFHLNQVFSNKMEPMTKLAIFTALLSLGGLPPFLGFIPKWIIIVKMTQLSSILVILIMVMTALITLFYYMRIMYSALTLTHYSPNWTLNNASFFSSEKLLVLMIIFISLSGLIVTPMILSLYM